MAENAGPGVEKTQSYSSPVFIISIEYCVCFFKKKKKYTLLSCVIRVLPVLILYAKPQIELEPPGGGAARAGPGWAGEPYRRTGKLATATHRPGRAALSASAARRREEAVGPPGR